MINHFPGGFTLLMSVYGGDDPLLFEKALASVIDNSLLPNQFILVIDGEVSDVIESLIERYNHIINIDLIRIEENKGLANALNVGMQEVDHEWVVRADADDINLPDRFEQLAKFIVNKNNSIDIVGGQIQEIDSDNEKVYYRHVPVYESEFKNFIKFRSPFNHMTVAYKKAAVLSVGGYPNLYLKEDYGLWALMYEKKLNFANLDIVLVKANAGLKMIERRGGFKYIISEYHLQKFLNTHGINNKIESFFILLIRSIIFMMPSAIRKSLYYKFLRISCDE